MKNSPNIQEIIISILKEKPATNINEIADKAGVSFTKAAERRSIQRVIHQMIEDGIIRAEGKARATRYHLAEKSIDTESTSEIHTNGFNDISLSIQSKNILQYISKPLSTRKPSIYNREFLFSYQPNKTNYLNPSLQEELNILGRMESENIKQPAGTYARNILNRLLIDLSWNSSRLEGNTYSILETKRLIESGENAVGKDAFEAQMILNHKDAIEYIIESANEKNITAHEIYSIHALLSGGLLGDPAASGRLREINVGISGTTYSPVENPHLLKEYFQVFVKKLNQIKNPFEQSFFSLVHLSYLQAFEDVNKRTARLVANIPLIKKNIKPLSFIDVNKNDYVMALIGVYEKNDISLLRDLYFWAYKRSVQRYSATQHIMGEPDIFKLKYRTIIQNIIRNIILDKTTHHQIVSIIRQNVEKLNLTETDSMRLFHIIETEIISLHEGNIARFKIRPSEFQEWKMSKK